ncbi:MAG: ornithine cyclodeaminase [Hyphomicrobiales bacterium]
MARSYSSVPYIDADTLNEILDFPTLADALEKAHRLEPPLLDSALLEHDAGGETPDGFYVLPAWFPGLAMGAKIISILPQNPSKQEPMPAVHALYPIFDGETGKPRAVIDGTAMTYWKTAADSALGSRCLSREDASRLVMVGAGDLSPWLVRAHCAVRKNICKVSIWNRTGAKAEAVAAHLQDFQPNVEAVRDLAAAVSEADIICCATSATEPVIEGNWLKPGAHIDLVGGFTPQMREADDEVISRARLFMDSEWFSLKTGDLSQPLEEGIIDRGEITDLFQLCRRERPGRQTDDEITLFKNAGGGHLDLMTAMHILSLWGK